MTLQECFEAAGSVFPFRVVDLGYDDDSVLCVVSKHPTMADRWIIVANDIVLDIIRGDEPVWTLYAEPKAKKKFWPYVIYRGADTFPLTVWALSESEAKARASYLDWKYYGPVPNGEPIEVDDD